MEDVGAEWRQTRRERDRQRENETRERALMLFEDETHSEGKGAPSLCGCFVWWKGPERKGTAFKVADWS